MATPRAVRNGSNMNIVLAFTELCWGDVGLALSLPRQGLGNAAIVAVANEEQKQRFAGCWAGMAITEPGAGSDSAAIKTTATRDGDDYVINGEKIYITAGGRCDHVVVWASLDLKVGRPAIKSFVVPKGTPGMDLVRAGTTRWASAPRTPPPSASATAACRPPTCWAAPRSTPRRALAA